MSIIEIREEAANKRVSSNKAMKNLKLEIWIVPVPPRARTLAEK